MSPAWPRDLCARHKTDDFVIILLDLSMKSHLFWNEKNRTMTAMRKSALEAESITETPISVDMRVLLFEILRQRWKKLSIIMNADSPSPVSFYSWSTYSRLFRKGKKHKERKNNRKHENPFYTHAWRGMIWRNCGFVAMEKACKFAIVLSNSHELVFVLYIMFPAPMQTPSSYVTELVEQRCWAKGNELIKQGELKYLLAIAPPTERLFICFWLQCQLQSAAKFCGVGEIFSGLSAWKHRFLIENNRKIYVTLKRFNECSKRDPLCIVIRFNEAEAWGLIEF